MAKPSNIFPQVPNQIDFPSEELKTLRFWKESKIFEQTIEARKDSPKGTFVFYEGPPTANGVPHNGHVLTRVIKDLFPRYRTMRGYEVPRKAGWDTHGLPVEVEVEKSLRIHGKAAIEEYGVEPFTAKCIESVFRYTNEWEKLTERIGFWVDLDEAYVTYHRSYVESVWWALKDLFKKGLLYRGHKVLWWWAQGGTALSSAEVGLGYKSVNDPSAYVAFPLGDDSGYSLLVWTTTPWTLPSNCYAAVHPELEYAYAAFGERKLVVAAKLVEAIGKKLKVEPSVERTCKGSELIGLSYDPPFDVYAKTMRDSTPYWKVISADFVTADATGIVHVAPAFGQDDHGAHQKILQSLPDHGAEVPLICAVKPDGTFVDEFADYAGKWVKDCDSLISKELKQRGILVLMEQYLHDYPYCWRADSDPLIQYARPTWYIRTTSQIDKAIANNRQINWFPEHIKEGRFGEFLANNVDWALSRERYWGTPLPIWENRALPEDHPKRYVAVESLAELAAMPDCNLAEVEAKVAAAVSDKEKAHHLLIHKPWIDGVTFTQAGVEGLYQRVPEVIDCWFDSGCMPFAQWGFPHKQGSHAELKKAFPADFISEALDQTRGWFYSLLMVATLVFDEERQKELGLASAGEYPFPYKACIQLGLVCDKEGKKESKSKGNYTPPDVILDRVRMEFAPVSDEQISHLKGLKGLKSKPGVAFIAFEDLEGLDVNDGAKVRLYVGDGASETRELKLKGHKALPRRVVLLSEDDRGGLGAEICHKGVDVAPVEVLALPAAQRVYVEDPATPAPGADAFRWFFYASSPPWTNTRHSLSNVRFMQKDFLIKLRNVLSFFAIYANIDGYHPTMSAPAVRERPLLDRWLLSELAITTKVVGERMDEFGVFEATQKLLALVEALSNWYVRRSRDRFWASGAGEDMGDDKRSAYATLHTCLVQIALLAAPFVPYFSETLYQALVVAPKLEGAKQSVHLEDFPQADESAIDEALSLEMATVRELVSLGLQVRTASKRKVRQPLRRADVVLSRSDLKERVLSHEALIRDELNVHSLALLQAGDEGDAVSYKVKPNFRALGKKLGKQVQDCRKALEARDAAELRKELVEKGELEIELGGKQLVLTPEEVDVQVIAQPGFAAAGGRAGVVILHTELDQELLDEGLMREVQSRLQAMRKGLGLGFTDRVHVGVSGSERAVAVVKSYAETLKTSVLIDDLKLGEALAGGESKELKIDGEAVHLSMANAGP